MLLPGPYVSYSTIYSNNKSITVKARFDYTPPLPSINNPCSDLAFKKGDILAITSTKSSDGWWEGHHVLTSKQHKQAYLPDGVRGYSVPSNFVSPTEWRALPFLYLGEFYDLHIIVALRCWGVVWC